MPHGPGGAEGSAKARGMPMPAWWVVVAAERLLAVLQEVLAHRAAGVGRDVLQRGGVGRGRRDDDRVVHRAVLFQGCGHSSDGGGVLADRHVDAEEVLALLVDDRVEQDGGLAGETVADDQLALAPAYRDHGVDRLDAGLDRAVDSLAGDNAWSDPLDWQRLARLDRALVVKGDAKGVHDAAEQLVADRNFEQPPGRLDLVTLVQVAVVAENDGPYLV